MVLAAKDPFLSELEQREQSCEAFFYVGQYHLLNGNEDDAVAMFRQAVETEIRQFVEYEAAALELTKLGR